MKKLLLCALAAVGFCTSASAEKASFIDESKWYQIKNLFSESSSDVRGNTYLGYYPTVQWYIFGQGASAKTYTTNEHLAGATSYTEHADATQDQINGQLWKLEYDETHDAYIMINKAHPNGAISNEILGDATTHNSTNESRWGYVENRTANPDQVCYFIISRMANYSDDNHSVSHLEIKNPGTGVGKYMNIAANPQKYQLMRNDTDDGGSRWRFYEYVDPNASHTVTYTVKVGNTSVNTFTELVANETAYSTPSVPAGVTVEPVINGQLLTADQNVTITVPANHSGLFKMVNASFTTTWATSSETLLKHTGRTANTNNSFASGEWFIKAPGTTDGQFNIWSVNQAKYAQAIPSNGGVPLGATARAEGQFKIVRNGYGPEAITNYNQVSLSQWYYFNPFDADTKIGGWQCNSDSGSWWFMVNDEEAYERNKTSFCYSGTADDPQYPSDTNYLSSNTLTFPYRSTMNTANAKLAELEALNVQLTDAQAKAKADLATAIANATDVHFGEKGVDVPDLLDKITKALEAVDYFVAYHTIIANGDAFAALGIASEAGVAAWNRYKNSFDSSSSITQQTITAATDAFTALVATSNATVGGAHIKLSPKAAPEHYFCIGNNVNYDTNGLSFHQNTAEVSAGKQVWTLKAAEGGFKLYNEYTNSYARFPLGTELANNGDTRVRPTDEEGASLFVFELQNATAGRVGIKYIGTDIEVDNERYYLHNNGALQVVRWGKGDNSSWYIHASDENEAANEYVNGAMDSSESYTSVVSSDLTGFYYMDVNGLNTARALETTDAASKRTKGDGIYKAVATYHLNMPTTGKVYTIRCTDISHKRGALIYSEGHEAIMTSNHNDESGTNVEGYDAADVNGHWAIYKDADNAVYLYNLAAKKFANIYFDRSVVEPGYASTNSAPNESHCWRFSEVPTAITEFATVFLSFDAEKGHPFKIYAGEGKNTTSGKQAGMFIVNNIANCPVPATAGFGTGNGQGDDAIGFWFTEVGTVSDELQAEMKALCEAYPTVVANLKEEFDAANAEAENLELIGHYTEGGFATYSAAKTAAETNGADPDTRHFHYQKGLAAERVALEDGGIYTLRTSENKHYAVVPDAQGNGQMVYTDKTADIYTDQEGNQQGIANTHYWEAEVENGVVSFKHNFQKTDDEGNEIGDPTDIYLEHNGATRFTVAHGIPGVVTLVPVVAAEQPAEKPAMRKAEGEAAPLTFTIAHAPNEAEAATTAINEINVDGVALNGAIFDLQGRRLAAPAKGINIIGGRKVLVK